MHLWWKDSPLGMIEMRWDGKTGRITMMIDAVMFPPTIDTTIQIG